MIARSPVAMLLSLALSSTAIADKTPDKPKDTKPSTTGGPPGPGRGVCYDATGQRRVPCRPVG